MPSPIRVVLVFAVIAVVATLVAQQALCSANTTGSGVLIWPQPMKATNGTSYTCLSPLFNITFDESFVGLGLAVTRYTDLMLEQHQVRPRALFPRVWFLRHVISVHVCFYVML